MSMTEERTETPVVRPPHGVLTAPPPRRIRRSRAWRTWMVGWLGATALGMGNAAFREVVFKDLSELRAHQVSTATLLFLLATYMWWMQRRSPLTHAKQAAQVGVLWAALTIAFEFALGLTAVGDSLDDLIHNYNFAAGRVWVLVPLWMLVGPEVIRRVTSKE